jgi:hypothetical protein
MCDLGNITDSFNKYTLRLLTIVELLVDPSAKLEFAKKKINTMINTDPVFIIDTAGEYIFKYRYSVNDLDSFSKFVMNTEEYIKEDDSSELKGYSDDNTNFAKQMIEQIRSKWKSFSEEERKMTHRCVKKMLSEYCKYLNYLQDRK